MGEEELLLYIAMIYAPGRIKRHGLRRRVNRAKTTIKYGEQYTVYAVYAPRRINGGGLLWREKGQKS